MLYLLYFFASLKTWCKLKNIIKFQIVQYLNFCRVSLRGWFCTIYFDTRSQSYSCKSCLWYLWRLLLFGFMRIKDLILIFNFIFSFKFLLDFWKGSGKNELNQDHGKEGVQLRKNTWMKTMNSSWKRTERDISDGLLLIWL